MKSFILASTLLLTGFNAAAEYKFGFADISVNRLTWTPGTQAKSTKYDFNYFEAEGGANFSWGEVYGFFDFENPGRGGSNNRTVAKGTIAYYIDQTPFSVYAQTYNFAAQGFSDQNQVLGLMYQINRPTWWFRPFLGLHEVVSTFYTGFNGYMLGWTLGWAFKVLGQSFLFADWHEFEFARSQDYANMNGGSRTGHNGAASIWWNPTVHLSLGFQWRYAQDKLGTPGALGAEIYSLKYNF